MIIYGPNRSKLMEIQQLSRDGNALRIRGKIMGTMPIAGTVTPSEARALLKLLGLRTMLFLLTLPLRRDG